MKNCDSGAKLCAAIWSSESLVSVRMGSRKVDLENCCISDEAVKELRKMLNLHKLRLGTANP